MVSVASGRHSIGTRFLTTQTQRRGGAGAQRAPQALLPPRTTSPDDFFFVTAAREATRSSPSGCSQENPGSWREVLYATTEPLCASAPLRLGSSKRVPIEWLAHESDSCRPPPLRFLQP